MPLAGSWAPLCHQVKVTGLPADPLPDPPESLLPHAEAARSDTVVATAIAANLFISIISCRRWSEPTARLRESLVQHCETCQSLSITLSKVILHGVERTARDRKS